MLQECRIRECGLVTKLWRLSERTVGRKDSNSNGDGRFVSSEHILKPSNITDRILQLCLIPKAHLQLIRALRTVRDNLCKPRRSVATGDERP